LGIYALVFGALLTGLGLHIRSWLQHPRARHAAPAQSR
jgi:hypothetical protein